MASTILSADAAKLAQSRAVVCLRGTGHGFHGRLFAITSDGARIGRNPECEILLNHPTVSRCHCRIDVNPEGVRVKDLGSINGTWINGRMGMESWLHQGDILRIGEVNFVVEIRPASEFALGKHGFVPVPVKTATTRLMGVREQKSRPIKFERSQGERPSQMARLTRLLFGRRD